MTRTLSAIHSDMFQANKRLRELIDEEAETVKGAVPCLLCKADIGSYCIKPSGRVRAPHAERLRAAIAAT